MIRIIAGSFILATYVIFAPIIISMVWFSDYDLALRLAGVVTVLKGILEIISDQIERIGRGWRYLRR